MQSWLPYRATTTPHTIAYLNEQQSWSFADLDQLARGYANQLASYGIGPGSRVAVLMGNGPDYLGCIHALIHLQAVLIPLNLRLTVHELTWQIRHVNAGWLISDQRHTDTASNITTHLPQIIPIPFAQLTAHYLPAPNLQPPTLNLAALHCLMFTSGTTGHPKAVQLSYGNHWWSAVGSSINLGALPNDRWLLVLPMFHIGGLSIVLRSVIYGSSIVIHERFDPALANHAIDTQQISLVSLVATMLERMLDQRQDQPFPPSLRAVLLGGGPAPRPLLERCAAIGLPVAQTYGMTETCSQAATLAPADALRKLGSAGKALLPTELRIEQDGQPVAPGEIGQIVVRGPTVTLGYDQQPEANATTFRDGWLQTGDLGYLDTEGYLYVVDRRTDLIISGGENIYPAEVESVLRSYPGIADAGVVGRNQPDWGQVVVAFVVPQPDVHLDLDELQRFCRQQLARYKLPRQYVIRPELPRNASGKLLRHQLRAEAEQLTV